jgi:hypothetical protein
MVSSRIYGEFADLLPDAIAGFVGHAELAL